LMAGRGGWPLRLKTKSHSRMTAVR
jgi:hypothetical protein